MEEPFIQVGKRDSLPRSHGCPVVTASPSRCQSHFATMPYKVSGSRKKQHSTKKVAAKVASHGPRYRLACTGFQKRTSTLNPVRSYFHVDSISAAGIERLTAESISTFRFAQRFTKRPVLSLFWSCKNALPIARRKPKIVGTSTIATSL